MDVRDCLMNECTLSSKNLYESYKIGGLQLENYLEISRDYIEYLERKYPGIKNALYEGIDR